MPRFNPSTHRDPLQIPPGAGWRTTYNWSIRIAREVYEMYNLREILGVKAGFWWARFYRIFPDWIVNSVVRDDTPRGVERLKDLTIVVLQMFHIIHLLYSDDVELMERARRIAKWPHENPPKKGREAFMVAQRLYDRLMYRFVRENGFRAVRAKRHKGKTIEWVRDGDGHLPAPEWAYSEFAESVGVLGPRLDPERGYDVGPWDYDLMFGE